MSVGLVEHLGAGDVGGHEVGRELDPLERQVENLRDCLDEQRLGESRHAGDQAVPAGEERDEDLIDDRILPDDDLADLGQDPLAAERDALGDRRNVSGSASLSSRSMAGWWSADSSRL